MNHKSDLVMVDLNGKQEKEKCTNKLIKSGLHCNAIQSMKSMLCCKVSFSSCIKLFFILKYGYVLAKKLNFVFNKFKIILIPFFMNANSNL